MPARKWIVKLVKILDVDIWTVIRFSGVLSERQRKKIIEAFPDKAFTHRDCVNLLGKRYLYADLKYLVRLGVLVKRYRGITGYTRSGDPLIEFVLTKLAGFEVL